MARPSDQDLENSVAILLRCGVTLSALVVLIGGILLHRQLLSPIPNYTHFHTGDPGLHSVLGILQGAINFTPKSVISLGLLLLIATPVARVLLCVVGFARQRNMLYVAISALVLLILILSFAKAS